MSSKAKKEKESEIIEDFGVLPIERAQMLAQITAEAILHAAKIEPDHESWDAINQLVLCGFCNGYNLGVMQYGHQGEGLLSGHEMELRLF